MPDGGETGVTLSGTPVSPYSFLRCPLLVFVVVIVLLLSDLPHSRPLKLPTYGYIIINLLHCICCAHNATELKIEFRDPDSWTG